MPKINLRDIYPHIQQDTYLEVSNEIEAVFMEDKKSAIAYNRKLYYHNAQYSLDSDESVEHFATFLSLSPEEIYQRNLTNEQLTKAMASLPYKQASRIYAHFFMGLSKAVIAQREGVSKSQVSRTILKGLSNLEKYFKNFF